MYPSRKSATALNVKYKTPRNIQKSQGKAFPLM